MTSTPWTTSTNASDVAFRTDSEPDRNAAHDAAFRFIVWFSRPRRRRRFAAGACIVQFRAIVPLFLAASLFVHAQEVPQATQPVGDPAGRAAVANPALRTELLEMMREDQAVRMMGGTPENAGEETNAEDAERTIGDGRSLACSNRRRGEFACVASMRETLRASGKSSVHTAGRARAWSAMTAHSLRFYSSSMPTRIPGFSVDVSN